MFDVYETILFQIKSIFKLDIPSTDFFNIEPEIDKKQTIDDLKTQLKTYLKAIYDKYPQHRIIFVFDSIDQLAQQDHNQEYENDFNINSLLLSDELPHCVKILYSTLTNYKNIVENFKLKFGDIKQNFIKLKPLDIDIAVKIIDSWLNKQKPKRVLNEKQWRVLTKLFKNATLYPLYVKLIFDIVIKWTSYYVPNVEFMKLLTIDDCIIYLFNQFERIHGKSLFSRCMFYLTIFENGISENELEDILTIDDEVLCDVFQHHEPTIRKFPIALWTRIKNDLKDYLADSKVDDINVVHW